MSLRSMLLVAATMVPTAGNALTYGILESLCIADVAAPPPRYKPAPIPIGCELVDCCPGCPAGGALEWRISIDAKMLTGAEVRFEGLSPREQGQLRLAGSARREGDRIVLGTGQSRIRGLPRKSLGAAPVGLLQPLASPESAAQMPAAFSKDPSSAESITDHIMVQQYLGPFVVNKFDWRMVMKPCRRGTVKPPSLPWDTLKIQGIAAGDDVAVMMDARTSAGCQDGGAGITSEQVFISTGQTTHPNLLSPAAGCNTEIAIFSKNNAMKWETNVPWTDSPGDVHTVALDPPIKPEIHIWVMDDATAILAETHFNKARDIYRENRVGVLFEKNIRKLPDAAAAQVVRNGVDPVWWDCLNLDAIKATPAFYTANTLNVYYVDTAVGGKNCAIKTTPGDCSYSTTADRPGDANITFLGTVATLTTLAHEIGHAYGLRPAVCKGHTPTSTFGPDNVMCAGSSCVNRSKLTLGQVFRMNTYADEGWGGTMLIPNNISSRVPRLCKPDAVHSALCPALELNWP